MISPTKSLVETFYTAFQKKDADMMVSCYHENVIFRDPAFGELHGEEAKAMWRMLCQNATDLNIGFSDIRASLRKGNALWEASYTFSKTGRKVHNTVAAEFEFSDYKIIRHTDVFNLHKWAAQALGWKGRLLGGTAFFEKQMQRQTGKMLAAYMKSEASAANMAHPARQVPGSTNSPQV